MQCYRFCAGVALWAVMGTRQLSAGGGRNAARLCLGSVWALTSLGSCLLLPSVVRNSFSFLLWSQHRSMGIEERLNEGTAVSKPHGRGGRCCVPALKLVLGCWKSGWEQLPVWKHWRKKYQYFSLGLPTNWCKSLQCLSLCIFKSIWISFLGGNGELTSCSLSRAPKLERISHKFSCRSLFCFALIFKNAICNIK